MIYIIDEIEAIVSAMRTVVTGPPFYHYGIPMQINRELLAKNVGSLPKYPAVLLRLPTSEEVSDGLFHFNLNIAIVAYTDRNYRTKERYENVYRPILYPLYQKFLEELYKRDFMWKGEQTYPPHSKRDVPFYSTKPEDRDKDNAFSDPLDAIEIINLKVNKLDNCKIL